MAKPMLVTWPFVMLLLDYWPLGRFAGKSSTRRLRIQKVEAIDLNRQGGSGEPPLPHRRLALVPGNAGSGHRFGSGWRANHGGPLLLYSINRFVHCHRVRISGHRGKATS